MSDQFDTLDRSHVAGDAGGDLRALAERHGLDTLDHETACSSGEPIEGRWRGVPLSALLDAADPEATHLVVEAADGFRVCVPVADALFGILAVERLDAPDEGLPRLVVPSVDGPRMAKHVRRLDTERLPPGTEPETLERLAPDSE